MCAWLFVSYIFLLWLVVLMVATPIVFIRAGGAGKISATKYGWFDDYVCLLLATGMIIMISPLLSLSPLPLLYSLHYRVLVWARR